MWKWLTRERNVRALGVIGTVIAAVSAGSWQLYNHYKSEEKTLKIEVNKALTGIRLAVQSSGKVHMDPESGSPCKLRFSAMQDGLWVHYRVEVKVSDLLPQNNKWFITNAQLLDEGGNVDNPLQISPSNTSSKIKIPYASPDTYIAKHFGNLKDICTTHF